MVGGMLRCRLLGHRYRFSHEGCTLLWSCPRECGASGHKRYPTVEEAERYARAFDRRDIDSLGRHAPLFGLYPLRLWRAWRDRRRTRSVAG
jgi:hypothetical protein